MNTEWERVLAKPVEDGSLYGLAAAVTTPAGTWSAAAGRASEESAMAPETIVWIASMTKAVSTVGVMALVESGVLDLDAPCGDLVGYLGEVQVLEGFGADGSPVLRPPKTAVTLRHLLTHTAGFAYDFTDATLARWLATRTDRPPAGSRAAYRLPLVADPGQRWVYGEGIDWAAQVAEAATGKRFDAYLAEAVLEPLGMADTTFALDPARRARRASVQARGPEGLVAVPFELPEDPEVVMAGGGLYSTVVDYLRFIRMLLGGGTLEGERILSPETVATMAANHIGDLDATGWRSANPVLTNDVEFFPGMAKRWGLGFLINTEASPEGRSAGSLSWAGLANSYFWVDPTRQVGGVFATQVLPFFDRAALDAFAALERAVYVSLL